MSLAAFVCTRRAYKANWLMLVFAVNLLLMYAGVQPVTEASVRKVTGGGSVTKLIEEIADDTTLAAREELLVKSLAKALVVDSIRQNLVADNVVLSPELLNAASHSLNCGVRRLLAQQLLRFADDHTTIREQLLRSHLFLALATLLVDEDLTVAQSAAKAAEKLVATTKGAWVRFSSDVFFDVLLTALRQGTTEVRLRLMGFFCRLALLPYPETEAEGDDDDDAEAALRQGKREAGQAAATAGESTQAAATAGESVRAAATAGKRPRGTLFKALAGRGVFDEIIQLSYIDDLLVKLNAVELIKELARSPEGLQFLIDVKLGAQLVQWDPRKRPHHCMDGNNERNGEGKRREQPRGAGGARRGRKKKGEGTPNR
eukprot:GHVT01028156.1.p1 GENE.GHVT01028156.1~~GHVT01028156.1.p1  ORF type:complete len:373 (-),score=87.96 GHVT01028156.1:1783-2901(-)